MNLTFRTYLTSQIDFTVEIDFVTEIKGKGIDDLALSRVNGGMGRPQRLGHEPPLLRYQPRRALGLGDM